MATAKKKTSPAKAPAKKAAAKATAKPAKEVKVDTAALDRKGMAAKARQLKMELLAIRFNLQSPSLKEYRKKREELASVLAALG